VEIWSLRNYVGIAVAPLSRAPGMMVAQVLSDVVPQNDIRAPQELASEG
jgi:hypothetical protein